MLEIHLVDSEIEDFVREVVNDFVKLDIVLYLKKTDQSPVTAEDISLYVGRTGEDINRALQELVSAGLVRLFLKTGGQAYGISDDPVVECRVEALINLYGNITERLKIISILLQKTAA